MKHSTQITQLLTCVLAAMSCPAMAQTSFPGPWWNPVESDAYFNTAMGFQALINTETGANDNTATGYAALTGNLTGSDNTATGYLALATSTYGVENTATGSEALNSNTSGSVNTASGANALNSNTTGSYNTASGTSALYANTTGASNTASGVDALGSNTTGNGNIALGYSAGYKVTTGANNIEIGNAGEATDGAAGNDGVIRIGTPGSQKQAFIAGIETSKITGSAVYVTAAGRLGVLASSERYKTAIEPMGANTAKLAQLRPVTFKLKIDAEGTVQYGLIAEEVAKVYPELVIRDANGRIDGVRYDELAPMLLNEVQKQQAKLAEVDELKQQIAELRQQNEAMHAALLKLKDKDRLLAQR
jgi:Chaperone of endosialidase